MVNTNGKCVHAFAAWLDLETQGDIYTTMVESAHKKGRLSLTKSLSHGWSMMKECSVFWSKGNTCIASDVDERRQRKN